ncbi:hypothetical protein PICMEDRAFT_154278 [Pichia membranifaciens NRRL Y-2026]|uniref:Uncharacterized protein n=1 Tax=Pichia membranifaciens NRRL Y-2026 TaxID=763406 RepID=A0A1E3NJC8_9ASCO|nr:hypothetical protein PICMEDRAFT_154278 [Pichia membranifaciens NRRL Y-2026]ODQ46176.1 hypothetical protein PICMEDRAFT_154278 [Pichia membranifaciens NRRL Y-2026]
MPRGASCPLRHSRAQQSRAAQSPLEQTAAPSTPEHRRNSPKRLWMQALLPGMPLLFCVLARTRGAVV